MSLFVVCCLFRIFDNCLAATLNQEERRLFENFSRGLSSYTISLLERYNCGVQLTPRTQTESVTQWTAASLRCQNLRVNTIPTVLCHADCVDPTNCTELRNLKGVPVNWAYDLADTFGNMWEIDLPVACKCVPSSSSEKCPS